MDQYWENVWINPDIDEYERYLEGHKKVHRGFLEVFKKYKVKFVCDAACGFGAYSAMLAVNGYEVVGFDVAASSIELTRKMLGNLSVSTDKYFVSSITEVSYPSEQFDAVVAHAVIDHLSVEDANRAVEELLRIAKSGGLVYLSFDEISEEDTLIEHKVMEDGSYLYTEGDRSGLLFKYYTNEAIGNLLKNRKIIYRATNTSGEREIIIQK